LKGWWNPHSAGRRPATTLDVYDDTVIGSGPGGAPLAARLGIVGNKILVLEAGQDAAATNNNATVSILNAKASEDEQLSRDFYVRRTIVMVQEAHD
jgi:choline dehydrogenase